MLLLFSIQAPAKLLRIHTSPVHSSYYEKSCNLISNLFFLMEFIHSELMDSTNKVPFIALQEQLFSLQIKVISSLSIPQVPFLCKSSKYIFLNTSYHSGKRFYFLCQNPIGSKGTMIKNIYLSEFLINNMLCLFPLFYWQVLQAYSLKGSTNFVTDILDASAIPRGHTSYPTSGLCATNHLVCCWAGWHGWKDWCPI